MVAEQLSSVRELLHNVKQVGGVSIILIYAIWKLNFICWQMRLLGVESESHNPGGTAFNYEMPNQVGQDEQSG